MNDIEFDLSKSLDGLKKLFKKKRRFSVGVDVGTRSIKIVELERKENVLVLKNYVLVKLNQKLLNDNRKTNITNEIATIVKSALEKSKIRTDAINTAIPGYSSLITMIELSSMPEKEIANIIAIEAPKYIPIPFSEVVYDWQILKEEAPVEEHDASTTEVTTRRFPTASMSSLDQEAQKEKVKVLLVVVMKEISKHIEEAFGKNKLKLDFLEVDSFSIKRSLIGQDKGNYLILDIGDKISNIIMVTKGNMVLNRNIDVAGRRFTEIIAKGMNVDVAKAEQMKISYGLELDEKFRTNLIKTTLTLIIKEITKSIEIFKQTYPERDIDSIVLSGGVSQMSGLRQFIEQESGIKTILGNPWSQIAYPKELEKVLLSYGPVFSVAIGLAMLGFEE